VSLRTSAAAAMVLAAATGLVTAATVPAHAAGPAWTKNCTALNHKYAHGVGKAKAHDHTSSGHPVTTFVHSDTLYHQAMAANGRLDGDHDGVACEKS